MAGELLLLNCYVHSPTKKFSPDLTTSAAATIDLAHYSGMGGSLDNIEAASNKYFELQYLRQRLRAHCRRRERGTRLDYLHLNITGKRDMNDFVSVSLYCWTS